MSMLATFVQVEAAQLARIYDDPGLTEELFAQRVDGLGTFDTEAARAAVVERGPQLLAEAMDTHPELRKLIEERLRVTHEGLQEGAGGDALFELMEERLGPIAGAAPQQAPGVLSLDKAWHGVHYLLTGEAEPVDTAVGQAVLGGTEIGPDFTGYGSARLFEPYEVVSLASTLADPAVQEAAEAAFDAQRMVELQIYPFGWDDDDRGWLLQSLRELARFYAAAAARGRAVVTCLE